MFPCQSSVISASWHGLVKVPNLVCYGIRWTRANESVTAISHHSLSCRKVSQPRATRWRKQSNLPLTKRNCREWDPFLQESGFLPMRSGILNFVLDSWDFAKVIRVQDGSRVGSWVLNHYWLVHESPSCRKVDFVSGEASGSMGESNFESIQRFSDACAGHLTHADIYFCPVGHPNPCGVSR